MTVLSILQHPDPRLRIKAQPVTKFDDQLLEIIENMYETMYANQGIGLAATQVNIHFHIFTMDIPEYTPTKICLINSEIIHREGEQFDLEGCLSVGGGARDKVKRSQHLVVRGLDSTGQPVEFEAHDLMAACVQHELDHLNGKLFVDHLSRLKQERITAKIKKEQRT